MTPQFLTNFDERRQTYIWENICDRLHLLPSRAEIDSIDFVDFARNPRQQEIVSRLIAFISIAAYGQTSRRHANTDEYIEQVGNFCRWNSNSLRLVWWHDKTLLFDLRKVGGEKALFDLGPVVGLSGVLPLSDKGYGAYVSNDKHPGQFTEDDFCGMDFCEHSVRYAYISSAVFVPDIDLPGESNQRPSVPFAGQPVFDVMARQLARFFPRLRLEGSNAMPIVRTQNGRPLPTIVCPLSGKFKGLNYLKRTGFSPGRSGRDGNLIEHWDSEGFFAWFFEFERINQIHRGNVRNKMVNVVRNLILRTRHFKL
jgi:hypothetical protein